MSAGRSSSTSDLERDALSAGRRVGDADRAGVSRLTSAQHWPVGCTAGGQEESPMILCATDLSPSAETATGLAKWLARRLDQPILLVHVVEPIPVVVPEVMAASTDWVTTMRESAAAQLERVAGELRKNGARAEARVLI